MYRADTADANNVVTLLSASVFPVKVAPSSTSDHVVPSELTWTEKEVVQYRSS